MYVLCMYGAHNSTGSGRVCRDGGEQLQSDSIHCQIDLVVGQGEYVGVLESADAVAVVHVEVAVALVHVAASHADAHIEQQLGERPMR